jgi:uncharacterized protein YndB with AHSA1/START domain
MTFAHRLSLAIPAQSAFAAITDLAAIPHWIPSIRSVRVLSREPVGLGTRFEQCASFAGIPFRILGSVTEYETPHRFAYRYTHGVVAGLWTYRIISSAHGCDVEVEIGFSNPRWLRPIVGPIVAGNIERFGNWAETRRPA